MGKPISKNFYDWCLDNNHKDWLELWDYDLNNCSPKEVGYGSGKKCYFKCPRGIHKSELKNLNKITSGDVLLKCKQCESFRYWCIENNHKDWLELWDYELNGCSPDEVSYGSGKKYWFKCLKGLHRSELRQISSITGNKNYILSCNQCNSIGQHLIDTYGEDALEKYWDYEKNRIDPFEISKGSDKKVWIKCQDVDYHESYQARCADFIQGCKCPYCASKRIHPKDSFGQMLVDEHGSLETIWDFEKNGDLDSFGLAKQSNKKVWLFCQETNYHGSYEVSCNDFYKGQKCPYCVSKKVHPKDSFGQMLIGEHSRLEVIWDFEKNSNLDPFQIAKRSTKKVWLFCQKDKDHNSYEISCDNYFQGNRCSYCKKNGGKVHPKDSFAQYHIDNTDPDFLEEYWSNKNTIDPFGIAPCSSEKVWMICQKDEEHEDYEITCASFTRGSRCGKCRESKGEKEIEDYLNANNIDFIPQKEFSDLVGVSGWKPLSYDFYLPEYNLLIEYQGEYHDGTAKNQTKQQFLKQQEHDKRKREYAESNNIRLLEIWYWDFKNIETILNKNIK